MFELSQASTISAKANTLVDILQNWAELAPGRTAYSFLNESSQADELYTYRDLDRRARAIAARLQARNAQGERALLLYHPGLDYLAAFFGCLYAGVIAVPAYPPRLKRRTPRIAAIIDDAQARFALTTGDILRNVSRRFKQMPELASLEWIDTEMVDESERSGWREAGIAGDTIAFLQYTSGSTSSPKGVVVSHDNLLHNLAVIDHGFQITQLIEQDDSQSGVFWLPVYHDMGLIGGILEPMYNCLPSHIMSPASFLQRPIRWLRAISSLRGTITGAPNFAYQLCVDKISDQQCAGLDLSSWRVAFSGAEPVRAATLEQFAQKFAPYGFSPDAFYPCYGLAESTLIAAGGVGAAQPTTITIDTLALKKMRVVPLSDPGAASAQGVTMVGCGDSLLDQQIEIVDPDTGQNCPPGQVGEIWLGGPSVAHGYWRRPALSEATFGAQLASGTGPYLRTGDLGFFHEGQLYVTGRAKDLIIIRGRNHYPQDIEETVQACHEALEQDMGAAFSVEVDGEERLVVTQELSRRFRRVEVAEVTAAIRQAVSEAHDLRVYAILLLRPLSIPKTSSGKIKRHACRDGYLEGGLRVIGEWHDPIMRREAPAAGQREEPGAGTVRDRAGQDKTPAPARGPLPELHDWLVGQLAGLLNIPPAKIDPAKPFSYFGVDSAQAVTLAGDLEDLIGQDLPPTLLWDYPTIGALSSYLTGELAPPLDGEPHSEFADMSLEEEMLAQTPAVPVRTFRTEDASEEDASGEDASGEEATDGDAIAIIGLGCRFPGAEDPERYWQLLENGVDAISEVPLDRFDADAYYHPEAATPGKMNTRWGGFLDHVDQFDPHFFGISPREAARIDPQQRLLLEVVWEALENAGQAPAGLAGTATGVYVGISGNEYSRLQFAGLADVDAYAGTGNAYSIAANRISYLLDLRGPSMAIDTACSSSLVAVHQAVQSLRRGETDLALAGGVNVILLPDVTVYFSQARAMAADGRCKAFDARADGYVRSEGCGAVVLKRLSDARRDGDNVLAVIHGSAVNQDGRSNGLTAPNSLAQQAVIRQALADAGLPPAAISYVEAHGTGTPLGDPIEVQSLRAVMEERRAPDKPYLVGSVKTNIGHAEAAAGIAGLIKTVLALQHEAIPAHLHFQQRNPYISLNDALLRIPTELQPWPRSGAPRLAGVSSFGFGGTNAHIVLGDALQPELQPAILSTNPAGDMAAGSLLPRQWQLLTLSGHTPEALAETAGRYADYFAGLPAAVELADICHTANNGRNQQPYRLALTAADSSDMLKQLTRYVGQPNSGGAPAPTQRPQIAFLFGGAGSQYTGMGQALYESSPVYRATIDRCDALLRDQLVYPLRSVLYPALFPRESALQDEAVAEMTYTQPALFATEYALYQLWRSWGVEPDLVLGHSVGELVAACVAGVFSLADGLRLVAGRGALMEQYVDQGLMAAAFASPERVQAVLDAPGDQPSISAINAPNNVVISGAEPAVRAAMMRLTAAGIDSQVLDVSRAAHSALVDPVLAPFAELAAQTNYRPLTIPMASTVSGEMRPAGDLLDAAYWQRHLRQPVRFLAGMTELAAAGTALFVELGPQPALLAMGRRCLPDSEALWLPSLRKRRNDWQVMLQSAGALHQAGVPMHWRALDDSGPRHKLSLPTTPFVRERYWFAPSRVAVAPSSLAAQLSPALEPRRMPTALPLYEWQPQDLPADRAGRELATFAARDLFGPGEHGVSSWLQAVGELPSGLALQASVSMQDAGHAAVQIFASRDGISDWQLIASGQLNARPAKSGNGTNGSHRGIGKNGSKDLAVRRLATPAIAPESTAAVESQPAAVLPDAPTTYERLRGRSESERLEIATTFLREVIAASLGMMPERLALDQALDLLGLDSLMAIEIKSRLEKELHVSVPVVRFLEGPTVSSLAGHLLTCYETEDVAGQVLAAQQPWDGDHPLSYNQQALWFLHELLPTGMSFNVAGAVRLRGDVCVDAFRRAFAALYARHNTLRLVFNSGQSGPVQRVQPDAALPFTETDGRAWSAEMLQDHLTMEAYRPFDLQNGPIIRMEIIRRGADEHILMLAMDHIVVDLWSISVLAQELLYFYAAEIGGADASGTQAALEPLPLQYTDYVYWEQALLSGEAGANMRDYWLGQLAGELPVLNLPTDRPRPASQSYSGDTTNLLLPVELVAQLRELGRENGATLYMTLLAAFQTLLHRYTGQEDLLVGTVLAGRDRPELAGLLGYFINPLAMRADFSDRPTFADFLQRARQTVLDAVANQRYPLPLLADKLDFPRDPSRPPIFETMFIMQQAQILGDKHLSAFAPGMPKAEMEVAGFTLESVALPGMPAQFDLTLMIADMAEGLGASLHYNTSLFNRDTVERMLAHFQMLLTGIIAQPHIPVGEIPLLPPAERSRLLGDWNQTLLPMPAGELLHELLLPYVHSQPDAIAVQADDRTLRYAELARESDQLAGHLQALGVGPGTLVGIGTQRQSYLLVGLLAILKAGGAYVPLDPAFPQERLALMLQDAQPAVLLTDRAHAASFVDLPAMVRINLDEPLVPLSRSLNGVEQSEPGPTAEDPAYVIYTSGSTGVPKGVVVPHRAIVNFIRSMQRQPGISAGDNLLAVTTVSFDIAALELFLPLSVGATVTLAPDGVAADGNQLAALLNQSQATMMQATPAGWQMLLEAGWRGSSTLRRILCGGEALPHVLAERLLTMNSELWNLYGPTETTVWSTTTRITDFRDVTIGRPIANTTIYLLDDAGQPAPIGVPGNLYIGGEGVALGYLNRPELNAERFVPDPFSDVPGATMYWTGDKARYRADGKLAFLGRDDHQVKIRGFRIELGDIEAALAQHPAGEQNVVIVREDQLGDKRLVAYLVERAGEVTPSAGELRDFLRALLPEYMVPSAFVPLPALPLTPNGKVNRRALPAPLVGRPELFDQYVAPRTEEEAQLTAMVAGVLNLEQVGIHDNFFELGGNSLMATRLIFQVSELAGAPVPLRYLFAEPTVAGLTRAVAETRAVKDGTADSSRRESLFGEMTVAKLQADVVLPAEIRAGNLPVANLSDPDDVFLTGVTGFLGAFLLSDLLQRTSATIHCLVRAQDEAAGMQRLADNMDHYDLWDPAYEARLAVVLGDLAKPRFGLSVAAFMGLAERLDVIYHNGAMVNFVYTYQTHRGSNVNGTSEILRLATLKRLKAVHFVSTLSVVHTGRHDDGRVYREDVDLVANGAPFGGYAQSKWVAEHLVLEAGKRGVPVAIYRPGPVSGHSESGVTNSHDMMSTLTRACLMLGSAPELDIMAELVPVDFVSGAIVVLSLRAESFGKTFHLANPHRWAYSELLDWVREQGYPLETIPYETWRGRLLTLARQFGGDDWGTFLPLLEETESGMIYMPSFDMHNTLSGLERSDVRCAPVGPELMGRYVRFFQSNGFIPKPARQRVND